METTFNQLVEEIQKLDKDHKEELKLLIEKYLAEERREEIYLNYLSARKEAERNQLKFNSDINELKKNLKE
jgi:hypothetical protein